MRIVIGRRSAYAIRAAAVIAGCDGRAKRHAIAAAIDAPSSVVAQVLADLARAGLVTARAGPRGGYQLARAPGSISLADILDASAEQAPRACLLADRACQGDCAVCRAVTHAEQASRDALITTTLDAVTFPAGPPARRRQDAPAPPVLSPVAFVD
jgi:Rrf2 family protein